MKKILFVTVLLTLGLITKAQLEKDGVIYSSKDGRSMLYISFYDARTTNPNARAGTPDRIDLTNVKVDIVIKKDTIHLYSGNNAFVYYAKPLKAKEIEIIISREGYHTLKEKWKVESLSISLRAYLTKKQEENTKDGA